MNKVNLTFMSNNKLDLKKLGARIDELLDSFDKEKIDAWFRFNEEQLEKDNEKATINLEQYRTAGSKVFIGKDRGKDIRIRSKLDELIERGENIEVIVPKEVMSVNPSFLEEFLFNAVKRLDKEEFYKRVTFLNGNERYDVGSDVDEAIDRILRSNK